MDIGDQVEGQGERLIGITYEPRTRALEVELESGGLRAYRPKEVWAIEENDGFIQALDEFFDVLNSIFGCFGIFIAASQFFVIANLTQKIVSPILQDQAIRSQDQWLAMPLHQFDEFANSIPGARHEHALDHRIGHGSVNGVTAFLAGRKQPLHGGVCQSSRRDVGDAKETDFIVRIQKKFQIGKHVLDFAPVKKALATDQMITDTGFAEGGFNGARLDIGAEKNGLFGPWGIAITLCLVLMQLLLPLVQGLLQGGQNFAYLGWSIMGSEHSIIIFPEGKRNPGPEPGDFKSGLYHLAIAKPGVELVPVYLQNLNRILPKGEFLPVPLMGSIFFGTPLQLREAERKVDFLDRAWKAVEALRLP